jgi:hypothetical protein
MEYRIAPEPAPPEREAIVAALAQVRPPAGVQESDWWRAGVRENVGADSGAER